MPRVFVHEAHHEIEFMAGIQQRSEDGIVGRGLVGNAWHEILQNVARERELGETEQLNALRERLLNVGQMLFEIALHVAEGGLDLSQAEGEGGHKVFTTEFMVCFLFSRCPLPARWREVSGPARTPRPRSGWRFRAEPSRRLLLHRASNRRGGACRRRAR